MATHKQRETIMNPSNQIKFLLNRADVLAMEWIEKEATRILSKHKNLEGFCMAMGSVSFSTFGGEYIDGYESSRAYCKKLFDFIYEFNSQLYLTGTPIKIYKEGGEIKVKKDW